MTPALEAVPPSLTHGQAYHKTSSTKLLINGENNYMACKKAKGLHFESLLK